MVKATGPVMSFLRVCRGVSQGRVPPVLEASASLGMKTAPIEAMGARLLRIRFSELVIAV